MKAMQAASTASISAGNNLVAILRMSPGHVRLDFAKSPQDYNVTLTPEQARPMLEQVALRAPPLSALYTFVGNPELGANEEVLGCLVAKSTPAGDVLDLDTTCKPAER